MPSPSRIGAKGGVERGGQLKLMMECSLREGEGPGRVLLINRTGKSNRHSVSNT